MNEQELNEFSKLKERVSKLEDILISYRTLIACSEVLQGVILKQIKEIENKEVTP